MNKETEIVVVGGGVVGLSTAWRFAQAGSSVTLLERGLLGSGASSAAAGMLAPFAEAANAGPFSDLGRKSLELWGSFAEELKQCSALDPELVRTGLLRVAEGDQDEADLRETYSSMRNMGSRVEWLDEKSVRSVEPALSTAVTGAIYSPTEWQVDPRRVIAALGVAAASAGVVVHEHVEAVGFETEAGRVRAVTAHGRRVPGERFVIAGGSWNTNIFRWLGEHVPVKPIRGQIAALGPCRPQPLAHTVYSRNGYLVPRTSGRILAGSTEDDAGYDSRPTASGIAGIVSRAVALAPALEHAPVETVWAGLRPMSPDRMPILGKLPNWDNVFAAAGHFRNGILLAPVTARLLTKLIVDDVDEIDPAFAPERFLKR